MVGWAVLGAQPFHVFTISATAGTLILLVAYILATLGAVRLLFLPGSARVRRWEVVVPVLGLTLLGERLTPTALAGILLIFSGIIVLSVNINHKS